MGWVIGLRGGPYLIGFQVLGQVVGPRCWEIGIIKISFSLFNRRRREEKIEEEEKKKA